MATRPRVRHRPPAPSMLADLRRTYRLYVILRRWGCPVAHLEARLADLLAAYAEEAK